MIDKSYIILIFFLFSFCSVSAQEEDFQVRPSIKLSGKIYKRTDLSADVEYRITNNAHEFYGTYVTLNPRYKLSKHFYPEIEFRFATSRVWDKFRYAFGLTGKTDIGKFTLSLRGKYEFEKFKQEFPEIGQFPSRNHFRLRAEATYKFNKHIKVYGSVEPRYRIMEHEGYIQRVDNIIGADWEFKKHHTFGLYYNYQPEYHFQKEQTNFILGFSYSYDIPSQNKKPKTDKQKN